MSWETVALGDVATLNPRDSRPGENAIISFVSMADLSAAAAQNTHETEKPFASVATGYTQFRSGDLLAAKITPCWENGKVGEATLTHPVGVGSTEFHVVRPNDRLDTRYALHFLRYPIVRQLGELRMTGSGGQRRVPRQFLSNLRIPLPEMEEQRRIAGVLDAANSVRAKRREQLALLDELPQSLFHEMFGGRSLTEPFSTFIEETKYGTSNKSTTIGTPTLRIPNVVDGRLNLSAMKTVPVQPTELDRLRLRDGDMLFVRSNGNPDNVGRCAVYSEVELRTKGYDPHQVIYASYLIRVRLSRGNSTFISAFMSSPPGRHQLRERSSTSAGQFNLNSTNLATVMLPRATLAEQEAFAEKVGAIRVERERVARALQADDELFAALQYRAFRGEL